MSFVLQSLVRGVLIPAGLAIVGLFITRLMPLRARIPFRGLALAASFVVAYILLAGIPKWPMSGTPEAAVVAGIIAGLWTSAEMFAGGRRWLKRYLLLVLLTGLTIKPMITSLWGWSESVTVLTASALIGLTSWIVVHEGTRQMTSSGSLAILVVLSAGLSVFMGLSGSALMSQLMGVVCTILGVTLLMSFSKWVKIEEEFVPFAVIMIFTLFLGFYHYVEISYQGYYWLFLPLLAFVIRYSFRWEMKPLTDVVVMGMISSAPVAFLLWQVYQSTVATTE